jgi:hypothetical protein
LVNACSCGAEPVLSGNEYQWACGFQRLLPSQAASVSTAHPVLAMGGFKGYETSLPRPGIVPPLAGITPGTSRYGIPATSNS